jgi:hypothetical protein
VSSNAGSTALAEDNVVFFQVFSLVWEGIIKVNPSPWAVFVRISIKRRVAMYGVRGHSDNGSRENIIAGNIDGPRHESWKLVGDRRSQTKGLVDACTQVREILDRIIREDERFKRGVRPESRVKLLLQWSQFVP